MDINANFAQRASAHTAETPWVASPMAGVDRRMLDRLGDEVARATSIVRYAPDSKFSPHVHTGGEEFFVLEGVFQDEHGDYPAGTYVRNPPTTRHTPGSDKGCVIFVKLWQFDLEDRKQFSIDTNAGIYEPIVEGVSRLSLHEDTEEEVFACKLAPGARLKLDATAGLEALVLEGGFTENGEEFVEQSWLRLPSGAQSEAVAGADGAKIWIKRNHLARTPKAPQAR